MPRSLKVAPEHIEYVKLSLVRNNFARQQDLAEALMISRDTVSRFFNGKNVSYLNFLEICNQLGLDSKVISFEEENEQKYTAATIYSQANIPHRNYSKFIGRKKALKQLLTYISPHYRQYITFVEGIGGVGKTTLVLETAHLCLEAKLGGSEKIDEVPIPTFDAIIYTSAKETYLTPFGTAKRPIKEASLRAIFQTITETLGDTRIMQEKGVEQVKRVYQRLAQQTTLLIIDNMETIKGNDQEQVLSFLADVPITVQVLITTRERMALYSSIQLESLSEEESLQLIQHEAKEKNIVIAEGQAERLYFRFGGIPLALIYAVGQRAAGYGIKRIIAPSADLPNRFLEDIGYFCFEASISPIRDTVSHKLLLSIALFKKSPSREAITEVAGLSDKAIEVENGLVTLLKLSLIRETEERFTMLSLTREYALAELAKYPEFEKIARERWISWYLKIGQKYGGWDWGNFQIQYDYLNKEWENLEEILSWLGSQQRYEDVKKLWKSIDNFVDIYGYWEARLDWWQWLQEFAYRMADLSTYVEALAAQGWTLILKGGVENEISANTKLKEAWKMKSEVDTSIQINLAISIAVIRKIQAKHHESFKYLNYAKDILNESNLNKKEYTRMKITVDYYICEVLLSLKDYDKSKQMLEQVIEQGKQIEWQRYVNYARNYLADIFIIQEEYLTAENLLKTGLFIAEQNKEKRRIALYQASFARLEKARQNALEAQKWAEKALEKFNREGIQREAEEMIILLQDIAEKL